MLIYTIHRLVLEKAALTRETPKRFVATWRSDDAGNEADDDDDDDGEE